MTHKILEILVPNLDLLDYLAEEEFNTKPGDLVIVPFRNKTILALVWKQKETSSVPIEKLRYIEQTTPYSLNEDDLKFMQWVANYYLFSLGLIFKMMIPSYIANFITKLKPHKEFRLQDHPTYTPPSFNPEQSSAIEEIEQLTNDKNHNIILDGVTGSGKTEVYLAAISKALNESDSAQVLVMLPEIALTSQITDRISKRFGYKPYPWHSGVTETKKRETFFQTLNGNAKIIIGARSALFLPYKNLRMIIVDEEHEQSYKQEDGVTYQARDMALMRAKISNSPILLASASPSLETIHNIHLGKLNLIRLTGRFNDHAMPKIHILDMKTEKRKNYYIAQSLLQALRTNLSNNQQSLLFINRKGYAPMLICNQCGHRSCCKNCSTGMVYHKAQKKLKCHQCGYVEALPKECPHCKSLKSFMPCGPGIERLTEEVQELLPNARVVTLTQESFYNQKKAEELLEAIRNKEFDIIIGTQIIAKGHHFPALTMVGIIDADSGMMSGDLRCAEKSYQLLQQVGGRAGRESDNSRIFIQTYNPEHPLILALASYNREQFIKEEMSTRLASAMPPYGRLAAIIISSKQEQKLIQVAKDLVKMAPITEEITLLGPAPALLYKVRGKFRFRILLKTRRNINIQKYINTWFKEIKLPSHVHLKIDIDPYHFF